GVASGAVTTRGAARGIARLAGARHAIVCDRDRRIEEALDVCTHASDQLVSTAFGVLRGGKGVAESNDNLALAHAPPALGQDSASADDGGGNDVDAHLEREHERALLERQQL